MNIYVGNLAREVTDSDLQEAFAAYGQVTAAHVINDRYSGQSRGFGFVEMANRAEALAAIAALNGQQFKGRTLNVNEARPREEGRREGGGGPRRTGGGGGGGGGGRRW